MHTKDRRWDAWPAVDENYFNSLADNLVLRSEIPQPIHNLIKQLKSVLRFCYYDYELIGVIMLLATTTFETALRLRYQELGSLQKRKKYMSFKELIDWGEKVCLFEVNVRRIHSLRELRNAQAHPKDAMVLGIMGINFSTNIIEMINSIYDPRIGLRVYRKLKVKRINSILSKRSKEGFILHYNHKRLIIFDARLLLYNNLLSKPQYYFAFYPIFEIPENATVIDEKSPILHKCISLKFNRSDNNWQMDIGDVYITQPIGDGNRVKFKNWKKNFKSCKMSIEYVVHQKFSDLRNELLSDLIYNEFIA